jgi:outer membrane protein W
MGASRDRRSLFLFACGGRGGAAGPIAAPLSAAALAIGLLTAAPAAVDGGKANDIPVRPGGFGVLSHGNEEGLPRRPAGGDGSPGAEWDLSSLAGRTVATDLVLVTTPHTVTVRRSTGGEVALGRVSIPSPKRRFRYHVLSAWRFSPYAGAAIGAPVLHQGNTPDPVHDGPVSGYALGAGVDVKISESWNVPIDARKVFLDGGTTGPGRGVGGREENSAPWVPGVGFGFLF